MPWASADGFHWLDYVVFSIILLISLFIGSITAFIGKKEMSKEEYVTGGRSMSVIPVSLSMVLSFISAILVLGAPAEMYGYGTMYWMGIFAIPLGCTLAALLFVPLLYPLKLISAYQYLELRFESRSIKVLASAFLVISQVIYIGIATFSPSTALEAATGFPTWASIIAVGIVATLYSALGGIKGTIWSSVFQGGIMVLGVTLVIIAGSIRMGGLARVWELNEEWGRIEFFDFNPDPTVRNTFWTLVVGGGISYMSTYGSSQASVQRYCSLPTLSKARQVLFWNFPFAAILITVTSLSGVIMFAYFAERGCDPLSNGDVANANQLMPYFIMQEFAWPGFPGLFVSTLFAGSLSTVAAALSAMASVTWEDFLKWRWSHLSDAKQTFVMKILVVVYGILGTAMAFATSLMGGHVMQASNSFVGAVQAPLLGLFLLGGIFPWANWIGALVGAICGVIMPMWISTGAYALDIPSDFFPMPTENCTNLPPPEPTEYYEGVTGFQKFYTISYFWYVSIGMATTVIVGLIVSFISGATDPKTVPKKYLIPFFDRMFCCLPEKQLVKCRHGYSEDEEEEVIDAQSANKTTDNKPHQLKTQTSYVECNEYTPKALANGHPEKVPVNFSRGQDNPAYESTRF